MQTLNIILITQGESPIVAPILNSNHNVIGIIEAAPRVEPKPLKQWLFNTLTGTRTLRQYANKLGIPSFYMTKHNNAEDWVKKRQPDLIVVYSMSQLLKENIFSIPKYGTINLHPSLLPKYRGPDPFFWTYYNQEKQGGVTVHYIDKGEDTGDIIYQETHDIPLGMTLAELESLTIDKIGIPLLLKAIDAIATGTAPRQKQPTQSPTIRGRNITVNEQTQLIDWQNWPIERIWHMMQGTELKCIKQPSGGQRWLIDQFEKCEMQTYYQAGEIYKEQEQYFLACRDGKILLNLKFSLKRFLLNIIKPIVRKLYT